MKTLKTLLEKFNNTTKKPICKICFQDIKSDNIINFVKDPPLICQKCFESLNFSFQEGYFFHYHIEILGKYNEQLSRLLIQYKEDKDVELAGVFLSYFTSYINVKYHDYYLVLLPSSQKKIKERGFNHLELMCKDLNLKRLNLFIKTDSSEQKKKKAVERANVAKAIKIINQEKVTGKNLLLFDDVLTTGSTMQACLNLLARFHPKSVKILVLLSNKVIN